MPLGIELFDMLGKKSGTIFVIEVILLESEHFS